MKIAIYGSGDFGIQMYCHFKNQGIDVVGFIDDTKSQNSIAFDSLPILGGKSDVVDLVKQGVFSAICLAIGYSHLQIKEDLYTWLKERDIPIVGFIHESCYIDTFAHVHNSAILYPRTVIDQRVVIEKNVVINLNATISHDTIIKENTFIAPGVIISGFCEIGKNCFIGSGAIIKDNLKISKDVYIGAGSVVVKNILKKGVYFGNPAIKHEK